MKELTTSIVFTGNIDFDKYFPTIKTATNGFALWETIQ